MSEDDKPIFPRPNDKSDEEKHNLYQETSRQLEDAEKTFERNTAEQKTKCVYCQTDNDTNAKFCRSCGQNLSSSKTPIPQSSPIKIPEEDIVPVYGPPPNRIDEGMSIMYGPPPTDNLTKTVDLKVDDLKPSPDDIHTTMYGPAPMVLDDLPKTKPDLKIEKENPLVTGLDYEEWKGRIPWLIIGGVIGFLIASVIILTLVLLVVAIR